MTFRARSRLAFDRIADAPMASLAAAPSWLLAIVLLVALIVDVVATLVHGLWPWLIVVLIASYTVGSAAGILTHRFGYLLARAGRRGTR